MGGKSNYLEASLLDHVFGATVFTPPETLYLAIFTTGSLTDASTGTDPGAVEIPGGATGYARVALANTVDAWAPAEVSDNKTVKVNVTDYDFAPAMEDWGTITQWALMDAEVEGNVLYYGILPRYREVFAGDILMVAAGQIRISED